MNVQKHPRPNRNLVFDCLLLHFIDARDVRPGLDVIDPSVHGPDRDEQGRSDSLMWGETKMDQDLVVRDSSIAPFPDNFRKNGRSLDEDPMAFGKLRQGTGCQDWMGIRRGNTDLFIPVRLDLRIQKILCANR